MSRPVVFNLTDVQAEHVQVKFYTEAGLAALEKGEGPSKLPDVKKDPVSPTYRHFVACSRTDLTIHSLE